MKLNRKDTFYVIYVLAFSADCFDKRNYDDVAVKKCCNYDITRYRGILSAPTKTPNDISKRGFYLLTTVADYMHRFVSMPVSFQLGTCPSVVLNILPEKFIP